MMITTKTKVMSCISMIVAGCKLAKEMAGDEIQAAHLPEPALGSANQRTRLEAVP
jgi:hypothetical protein